MKREQLLSVLEVTGGIAGAALALSGIVLLVIGVSEVRALPLALGLCFCAAGLVLALKKDRSLVRAVVGAVVLVLLLISWIAALLIPGLRRII